MLDLGRSKRIGTRVIPEKSRLLGVQVQVHLLERILVHAEVFELIAVLLLVENVLDGLEVLYRNATDVEQLLNFVLIESLMLERSFYFLLASLEEVFCSDGWLRPDLENCSFCFFWVQRHYSVDLVVCENLLGYPLESIFRELGWLTLIFIEFEKLHYGPIGVLIALFRKKMA